MGFLSHADTGVTRSVHPTLFHARCTASVALFAFVSFLLLAVLELSLQVSLRKSFSMLELRIATPPRVVPPPLVVTSSRQLSLLSRPHMHTTSQISGSRWILVLRSL